MKFDKVNLDASFKDKQFSLDDNMEAAKTEDTSEPVSKIEGETYPMYIPDGTTLANRETVEMDDGERVIMTYEGDNPFMVVQQTASVADEHSVVSVYGDPLQLATGVAAVSDNMISWVSNGIEYYVVSDNMSESELISVASSVGTMPVSK